MKSSLDFNIPFSVFSVTDFISCFASTYMFLEEIDNGTGDAHDQYFFLFDTMCGRSALRCRFDNEPSEMQKLIGETEADGYHNGTDYTIDFLFGFAGYEYRKCIDTARFKNEIVVSIDAGKPVIAKVNSGNGRFRVITGYDGENLINPDYAHVRDKPQNAPSYEELDAVYIIGDKITPRYTLKDGLDRIRQVMEYNINEKLWDGCIEKMGGWIMFPSHDGLDKAGPEERKARMQRLTAIMWYAMNCHMFGETFRNCRHEELRNPAFSDLWKKVSDLCYSIDALIYAIDYLNGQTDWANNHFTTAPGISAMIAMAIEKVKANDMELLDIMKKAIGIFHESISTVYA